MFAPHYIVELKNKYILLSLFYYFYGVYDVPGTASAQLLTDKKYFLAVWVSLFGSFLSTLLQNMNNEFCKVTNMRKFGL